MWRSRPRGPELRPEDKALTMKRTTHRSKKGKKLYAVRRKNGRFADIQSFKRAHSADLRKRSKAEKAAKKRRK